MLTLGPDNMFSGKNLPAFIEASAPMYRKLVEQHGRDKVYQVYDYFFAFVSRLQWGQWMVLQKVCPKQEMRLLFYWVMELIYQSDLCSQMRFEYHHMPDHPEQREVRIVVVPPPDELMRVWAPFLGAGKYNYINWFGRIRENPACNADINPEWLMLEVQSQWGDGDSGDEQHDDGGGVMPPPPED